MSKSRKSKNQVTLEDISEKLDKIFHAIVKSTETVAKITLDIETELAKWAEQKRTENAKEGKRLQMRLYYQSIVVGLLVGIFGNLFASYVFEFVKPSVTSTIDWGILIIVGLVLVALIVYIPIRAIRELERA